MKLNRGEFPPEQAERHDARGLGGGHGLGVGDGRSGGGGVLQGGAHEGGGAGGRGAGGDGRLSQLLALGALAFPFRLAPHP